MAEPGKYVLTRTYFFVQVPYWLSRLAYNLGFTILSETFEVAPKGATPPSPDPEALQEPAREGSPTGEVTS